VSGLLHMLRKGERMITEEMRKGRIIGDFLSLTNSSDNHKLFVEMVKSMHRSLQQQFMGAVWMLIKSWAKDFEDGNYDLRNEETCKVCDEIVEKVGHERFP